MKFKNTRYAIFIIWGGGEGVLYKNMKRRNYNYMPLSYHQPIYVRYLLYFSCH